MLGPGLPLFHFIREETLLFDNSTIFYINSAK
jgi:hypothetical protein